MKIKYLKRYLSVLLTGLISLNAISFVAFAEETDDSSHFSGPHSSSAKRNRGVLRTQTGY